MIRTTNRFANEDAAKKKKVTFGTTVQVFFIPQPVEKIVEDRTLVSPAAKPVRIECAPRKRVAENDRCFQPKHQKTSTQQVAPTYASSQLVDQKSDDFELTIDEAAQILMDARANLPSSLSRNR